MDDPHEKLKKFLIRKIEEEQKEQYEKQIPFRETDESYLRWHEKKGHKGVLPIQRNKYFMIMELLSHVPAFKKDIIKLRGKLGIKDGGLESWAEVEKWVKGKGIEDYQFNANDNKFRKDFPSNVLEKESLKIGIKYRLPFNFYGVLNKGLQMFILTGRIVAPDPNYTIDFHIDSKGKALLWTALVVYAPLSEKELKYAVKELQGEQKMFTSHLGGSVTDAFARKRYRDTVYRDIIMLDEQVGRNGKPKKVKKYMSGSYMDIFSKVKMPDSERKRIERLHKSDFRIVFNGPTSDQIGKKQGVSGEAARQAKKRLNVLAKELFGHGLEP